MTASPNCPRCKGTGTRCGCIEAKENALLLFRLVIRRCAALDVQTPDPAFQEELQRLADTAKSSLDRLDPL